MGDTPASVERDAAQLDRAIEGYLCGLAAGAVPDRDRLIDEHPSLAEELKAFFRHDDRMRRLAGSEGLDGTMDWRSSAGNTPGPALQEDTCTLDIGVEASRVPGDSRRAARGGRATRGGSTFCDYDLLEEIGRGAMGVVYKARQRSLNRIVALKMILSAQLASELDVQRFYSEAESAAHLDHPGIVPVYAVGEHEGEHYYSMGFVDGISLQELVADETVLPAPDAAELVRRVAEAIHSGHRRGVIHRDLKPANILLAESDREDAMRLPGRQDLRFEPKVTDFGLAKKTQSDSELTRTGQILGTPSYMPPEQAAGQSDQIGPLSDVYSLGAVLYCLLTARPPFRAASVVHTLQQVIRDEPVPPRRVNSAVPRDLETICLKCLQKNPGRRYGSAQELAADLKRYRDDEPITARPISPWQRGWKWARRRPATATLMVVGLITLMAFVGLVVSWRYQGERERLLYSRHVLLAHLAWRNNEITRAQDLLKECPSHLRGWEWDYVDRLCRTGLERTITPPESIDGLGPLCVWKTATGEAIATLEGHTARVTGVVFSPDGQQLATASRDGSARLWNLETGREIRAMGGHAKMFPRVAFSPDGSRLATNHLCRTFPNEEVSRDVFRVPEPGGAHVSDGVASGPDGEFGAAKSDGTVRSWDAEDLADTVLKGHSGRVKAVALSPDCQRLASAGDDGRIKLWDVPRCREILPCEGHSGPVYDLAFSPDGKRLASAGNDLTVRIWDALTGRVMLTLDGPDGHTRAVRGVAFHPDGSQVASAGVDLAVKIWNVGSGSETAILQGHTGPVQSIAFQPDGKVLASAGNDGLIKLWRPETGQLVGELNAHDALISAITFSPDGRLLASASHDGNVKLWDVESGRARTLEGHRGNVYGVAFSPDGRLLASAGHDGNTLIWDTATGRKRRELPRNTGPVICVVFGPLAGRVAVGGADFVVTVWDWERGVETASLSGHAREVLSVAYSPDGGRLVSGSRDGTVRMWHATTGRQIATLEGHLAPVSSVVFSPAGDRIASTSWDGTVRVWDPESGQETLSLNGQIGRAYCVAFSPAGHHIASANHDGTITLWGR